jgi:hypothetical protein
MILLYDTMHYEGKIKHKYRMHDTIPTTLGRVSSSVYVTLTSVPHGMGHLIPDFYPKLLRWREEQPSDIKNPAGLHPGFKIITRC